jgi:sugar/nucleoside kinase (ribokinase family)
MSRRGIVLAGSVILDVVNTVDHWPAEETVSFIRRTDYGAGGPPHNAAAGLAKLGAPFPVKLLGATGEDTHGAILRQSAEGLGLDVSGLVARPGVETSYTHVMQSEANGRRTFFHQPGVSAVLAIDDLLPTDDSAKMFYAGSPGVMRAMDEGGLWPELFRRARARGFQTCLELVPVAKPIINRFVPPCLPHCDIVVINDHEAEAITGDTIVTGGKLDAAAALATCRKLLAMGVGELAAIHHPDGAVAVTRDGTIAKRGSVRVPPDHITGTVGAGDAFFAGMLLGIHEAWPLERSLDLGNAAAATSLRAATTSASIRPWAECFEYAAAHGLRNIS